MTNKKPHIVVKGVTMAYGSFVIQHDLNFTINPPGNHDLLDGFGQLFGRSIGPG